MKKLHETQKEMGDTIASNEKFKRELFTREELIKSIEEQHSHQIVEFKEKYIRLEQSQVAALETRKMMYEDLRTYSNRQHIRIVNLEAEVVRLTKELAAEEKLRIRT